MEIIYLLIGLAVGAVASWLVLRFKFSADSQQGSSAVLIEVERNKALQAQLSELKKEIDSERNKVLETNHSLAAAEQVKLHGQPNDLLTRLAGDPAFAAVDVQTLLRLEDFVGRAPEQVVEFNAGWVEPIRQRYSRESLEAAGVRV